MSPRSAKAAGRWLASPPGRRAWAKAASSTRSSSCASEDGDSSDDEDLGLCPAYSENAALPSAGSAGHGAGTCRRCCFFPKGRCNNGYDCNFCHFFHEKRKPKTKKKKHKRKKGRKARGESALVRGDCCQQPLGGAQFFLQEAGGPQGFMSPEQLQELGLPAGCFMAALPAEVAAGQAVIVQVPFCAF